MWRVTTLEHSISSRTPSLTVFSHLLSIAIDRSSRSTCEDLTRWKAKKCLKRTHWNNTSIYLQPTLTLPILPQSIWILKMRKFSTNTRFWTRLERAIANCWALKHRVMSCSGHCLPCRDESGASLSCSFSVIYLSKSTLIFMLEHWHRTGVDWWMKSDWRLAKPCHSTPRKMVTSSRRSDATISDRLFLNENRIRFSLSKSAG